MAGSKCKVLTYKRWSITLAELGVSNPGAIPYKSAAFQLLDIGFREYMKHAGFCLPTDPRIAEFGSQEALSEHLRDHWFNKLKKQV